ncbi:unnamed protein product [Ilex paraguariensis]|uniref:Uncharacterized protein n=1 Tax=Ilex paraguariensis TaxID=185542 RepID=A0ABC8SVT6_9AQUA
MDNVFDIFLNEKGKFRESLTGDTNGMLSLYEASFLGTNGEDTLTQAMEFTTTRLKDVMPHLTPEFGRHIGQALELPIDLRMARLEAKNYTDQYVKESNWSSDVLELAKLDFNLVQSLHQTELAELVRQVFDDIPHRHYFTRETLFESLEWWKELGLCDKLTFARDRPLECFLWTVGIFPKPHQSTCRIELAKNVAILLVIDDIFDSYGTLSELVLFTNAIRRWDLGAMEELPQYMKICYMALYNTTKEIGYRVLKEHGSCIVSHLKRTQKICTYPQRIFRKRGHNSRDIHGLGAYFLSHGASINRGTCRGYPKLFSCSGRILRLRDDLETATEEQQRGDVASSIECFMKEQKLSSEAEARTHIKQLIQNQWKELNAELMAPNTLPLSTIKACCNLSRTAQAIYDHGHDNRASWVHDHADSLFCKPIVL